MLCGKRESVVLADASIASLECDKHRPVEPGRFRPCSFAKCCGLSIEHSKDRRGQTRVTAGDYTLSRLKGFMHESITT